MKLQLVFARKSSGQTVQDRNVPPVGILTLAEYLLASIPQLTVEVFDGSQLADEKLIESLTGDVVGFSTWWTNYPNSISIARKIKQLRPDTKVLFGGPHASTLAKQILENESDIDFVFTGDGEKSLKAFLEGVDERQIPGLCYRESGRICENPPDYTVSLNSVPHVRVRSLATPFDWKPTEATPGHSYFAISKFRGCFRTNRCEYCSIPVESTRSSTVENFWEQIEILYEEAGIDCFFETADIFPVKTAKKIAEARPDKLKTVKTRFYLYPGMAKEEYIEHMIGMGTANVFYGVESLHYFEGNEFSSVGGNRTSANGYSTDSLLREFQILGDAGITVMPSMVLGLPGESQSRLKANLDFAKLLSELPHVREMSISPVIPLPGSDFFKECLETKAIASKYQSATSNDLRKSSNIDFFLLSKLLIQHHAEVEYERLLEMLMEFVEGADIPIAHWGEGSEVEAC